jgi:hypothetical protein
MSLVYKTLESITASDLQALIDNQVRESLYIEYKSEAFDKRDDKKRLQFLGSISGFANAAGGDLLVGVEAINALPMALPGLDPADVDSEILRIRQVVGTSIEPQLVLHFQAISLQNGRSVLIIRVPQSWTAPHGIEQGGHFQFFRRHAAGRSPMTLSELRSTFTLSGRIVEQTRRFRAERLAAITAPEGLWPNFSKFLSVLHIIPFAGVAEAVNVDLARANDFRKLSPMAPDRVHEIPQGDLRYNLDGVLMRDGPNWHTQLFRNGSIEYAASSFEQGGAINAWSYQTRLLVAVQRFFAIQKQIGTVPPLTVMLSVLNVANLRLRTSEGELGRALSAHQIDRGRALLPEIVLDDFDADLTAVLKPIFDALWNLSGEKRCMFYKADSTWVVDPSWLDPPDVR